MKGNSNTTFRDSKNNKQSGGMAGGLIWPLIVGIVVLVGQKGRKDVIR